MRSLTTLALLGLLLLCSYGLAWCQEEVLRLTPDQAAELALANSLELQIDAQSLEEAYARVRQAYASDNLQIALEGRYVRMGPVSGFELPPELGGGKMSFGSTEQSSGSLKIIKPLYTGHRVERQARAARSAVEATRYGQDITRLALSRAAHEAAYGVLLTGQLSEVAEELVTSNQEHLRIAQAMLEAGVVPRFEVVQAQTELSKARGQLISTQTEVELAKAGLRRVLTVPQTTEVEVADSPAPELPEGTLPELIQTAWENRPEIAAAKAGIAAAKAGVQLALATKNLSVNLAGQVSRETETSMSKPTSWNVAVAVTKPLHDGGIERSLTQEAMAKLRSAQLQEEIARQQIALGITQEYVSVAEARQQVEVAEQGVTEAEERLRIARVRFTAGVTVGVEVIDSQTALAAAQAALINARYDLRLATMRLHNSLALELAGQEQRRIQE